MSDFTGKDFTVRNEGAIVLFQAHTDAARAWWDENVQDGITFAGARVVEWRYAQDIIQGIAAEGLTIGGA